MAHEPTGNVINVKVYIFFNYSKYSSDIKKKNKSKQPTYGTYPNNPIGWLFG
jgi:hypothetical protein